MWDDVGLLEIALSLNCFCDFRAMAFSRGFALVSPPSHFVSSKSQGESLRPAILGFLVEAMQLKHLCLTSA